MDPEQMPPCLVYQETGSRFKSAALIHMEVGILQPSILMVCGLKVLREKEPSFVVYNPSGVRQEGELIGSSVRMRPSS